MKTIREMAEEYSSDSYYSVDKDKKEKIIEYFETGANYVLEELTKILPKEDKLLNDVGKALLWRLNNCIKQLKNNQ